MNAPTNTLLTVEEFNHLRPWPAEALRAGQLYEKFWHYELPVAPEELWDQVMDTSRLNRELGYGEIDYVEKEGRLLGASGRGRFREEWTEHPWEWNYPVLASRLREYSTGFLTFNLTGFYLQRLGERATRIYVYIGSTSVDPRAARLIPGFLDPFQERYRVVFEKIAAGILQKREAAEILSREPIELAPAGEIRLESGCEELRRIGFAPETVARLRRYLVETDRNDLVRIRVVPLARQFDLCVEDTLRLFLHGVRAGLFLLSWDVICPHCRGARDELPSLALVPRRGSCDVCAIEFENTREDSIEMTFRLHPTIGQAKKTFFCSAETARKKHIRLQQTVLPGENRIESGFAGGDVRAHWHGGPTKLTVELREIAPGEGQVPEMRTWFKVTNPDLAPRLFTMEDFSWARDFLKPSAVFNLQEFRDLFSEEHLATDLELDIGVQVLVFTDMVGSTRFYESRGDGPAFLAVKKLFQVLAGIVRSYSGVFVKTMGDGAMLTFPDARRALGAALAVQREFRDAPAAPVRLRVAMHRGPCLAVNFNTGIDYFGRAVNLAAKLQQAAGPGEIVVSDEFREAPGLADFLAENALNPIPFEFRHEAFTGPILAFRFSAI